jgi:hypothetical protein
MKTVAFIAAALLALILGMIVHLDRAHAAPAASCGPLQPFLDQLAQRYHEYIVIRGDVADQKMIVTAADNGSFSVLLTDGKTACMILAGEKAELDKGI